MVAVWETQPWYTLPLDLLVASLIQLLEDVLINPHNPNIVHPVPKMRLKENTPVVTFAIGDPMKTITNIDHTGEIRFKAYQPDRRLCVARYLKEYERTENYRKDKKQLFLGYKAPHDEVGRDTISTWNKHEEIHTTLRQNGSHK